MNLASAPFQNKTLVPRRVQTLPLLVFDTHHACFFLPVPFEAPAQGLLPLNQNWTFRFLVSVTKDKQASYLGFESADGTILV